MKFALDMEYKYVELDTLVLGLLAASCFLTPFKEYELICI